MTDRPRSICIAITMAAPGHTKIGEQSCHQFLNLLRDAVVVERGADVFARGDEVHVFFEENVGGDAGGALGGGCEFSMQGIVDVE